MRTNPLFDFSGLTAAERIELAQDLWDSLTAEEIEAELPLDEAQRAELDRRLDDLERHPEAALHGRRHARIWTSNSDALQRNGRVAIGEPARHYPATGARRYR